MKLFKKMKNGKGKKGFTLAEMLIVIALLAILMAVAVPSTASYVRRIKLMELDDSARAIFMAVQNKMTVMKQSGVKLDLTGSVSPENGVPEEGILPRAIPISFQSDAYPSADPAPDGYKYVEPDFRFIRSSELKTLGEKGFVNLGSIEGQLYNHNFVIEYDAAIGEVFGVFYSEENDLSDYPDESNDDYYKRDFEDRLKEDKLVGYYGGGEVKRRMIPEGGEEEKPHDVVDSTLEKLAFMLDPPKNADGTYDTGKYYFEVTITGKDANGKEHTIDIIPYDPANPANNYYVEGGQRGTVILDSIAPGCGDDHGQWNLPTSKNMSNYVLERDFKGWVYIKDKNFVDSNGNPISGAPEKYDPYIHSLSSWNLGKDYVLEANLNPNQTAQYFRIDPGSDITVSIKRCKADGGTLESLPNSSTVNSYFDSLAGDCAIIKAGRHLQNLANYVDSKLVKTVRLEEDIDFSKNTNNYDSWNSPYTYRGNAEYPYLYNFKPIFSQFVEGSTFPQSFDGNGKVIKYIRIDTVNDPRFNDDEVVRNNTSFFVRLYNTTASGVSFYCPVVIGNGDYAGMFFGQCTGGTNIQNYTLVNPIIESSGKYVGGLFGEISGGGEISGHKVYVEEVDDYFDNYHLDYSRSDDVRESIKWGDPKNDPYSRFGIKGTGSDTYAGGVIGHIKDGQLKNSCAAIRVVSEGYAGGLIGLAEGQISKSFVGGHTHNGSFELSDGTYLINIDGKKGAGGLAASATSSPDGCYTTCSVGKHGSVTAPYDTFIGSNSGAKGRNGAYAIGALIDAENRIVTYPGTSCNDVKTDIESIRGNGDTAISYDPALKDAKYPYENGAADAKVRPHIGDWSTKEPVFGMFYWEQNSEGKYAVRVRHYRKSELQEEISTLCAERDGKAVTDYGYGIFYTEHTEGDNTPNNPTITVTGAGADFTNGEVKSLLSSVGIADVKLLQVADSSSNTEVKITFNCNNGSDAPATTAELSYQPLLCALGETIEEYQVRNVKQLRNLSTIAQSSNCSGKTYVMTHDIVFNGESLVPIGSSSTPFAGTFDGGFYRIVNAKLAASGSEAGVFGAAENAVLKNVIVFNADFTGISLSGEGAMGGIVGRASAGTNVESCAFTGRIDVSAGGSIAAGGIVGRANGIKLEKCEAVMYVDESASAMTVSGSGIAAAGGIAGMVQNTPISYCYSGGRISVTNGSEKYIGGIIGTNATDGNIANISNCYTYYKPIGDYSENETHPIGRDRLSGGDEVRYFNCHYLGGATYTKDEGEIAGVKRYDQVGETIAVEMFKNGINAALIDNTNFYSADIGYETDLNAPMTYSFPAVIYDGAYSYHYGKSPANETAKPVKDRFGVFYWEKEDNHYRIKALYYEKELTGGVYQCKTLESICREQDGKSITQSGYGYFATKKPEGASADGFIGDEIANSSITGELERQLNKKNPGEDIAGKLSVKCFDYTNSDDVSERIVRISSDYSKEFKLVQGLCALGLNDGTALNYEIRTQQHLMNISRKLDGVGTYTFTQSHDIICANPLMPIGDAAKPFNGTYDGGCYRIQSLKVDSTAVDVGLFGKTNSAVIKNVVVVDGQVRQYSGSSANVGGIVGSAENNTTVTNCVYTGKVTASVKGADSKGRLGGIAGYIANSTISRSEAVADVSVTDNGISGDNGYIAVGGIAGGTAGANIQNSYSGGSMKISKLDKQLHNAHISGIIGFNENGNTNVNSCYTYSHIPAVLDGMTVHPIAQSKDGAAVTMINCHYIEGNSHYANSIDNSELNGITKHTALEYFDGIGLAANRTYRHGLTVSVGYPLPAVVANSKGERVHYGDWKDNVTPLSPTMYGMFYWEREGDDKYAVKVKYYENDAAKSEISTLCSNADGKAVTDYGYGYLSSRAVQVDKIELSGKKYADTNADGINKTTKEKLEAVLRGVGFSAFEFDWVVGESSEHKDANAEFKYNEKTLAEFKYSPDFCALSKSGEALSYEVRTAKQLDNVRYYLDCTFTQSHDIVFKKAVGAADNSVDKFTSIGDIGEPFKGTYNGGNYRIVGINIDGSSQKSVGLFGAAKDATITNTVVFNGEIAAEKLGASEDKLGAAGGIVGLAENTKIEKCAFTGRISASAKENNENDSYAVGGIAGCAKQTDTTKYIANCEAVAKITWSAEDGANYSVSLGEIAGKSDGEIRTSYSGGELIAKNLGEKASLGGIVGSGAGKVETCYSYASVTADDSSAKSPMANGAAMKDCYYLKGEKYYNGDAAADGVTACDTLGGLQTALKAHFKGDKLYFAAAYTSSLSYKQMYALATVLSGNVHYGDKPEPIGDEEFKYPEPQKKSYKVTVENVTNGTIEVDPTEAVEGTEIKVTVKPNEGYKLDWININGAQNVQQNQNVYTFKMPEQNVSVTAQFGKIDTSVVYHKVTYTKVGEGSVTLNQTEVKAGDTASFTVQAADGYKLKSIELTGGAVLNREIDQYNRYYDFVMPDNDVEVKVTFVEGVHNITVNVVGKGTVNYDKQGTRWKPASITVIPDAGWVFDRIEGIDNYWGNDEVKYFTMPDADVTLTVIFKEQS